MDLFGRHKARGKWILGIVGAVIVLISMFYTSYLSRELAREEHLKMEQWLQALQEVSKPFDEACFDCEDCCDLTFPSLILKANSTIPMVLVSRQGRQLEGFNYGNSRDTNQEFLERELQRMKKEGVEPVISAGQEVFYRPSRLLTQLQYFPLVQLLLFSVFVLFGYFSISAARRAEQNRVWVGLAKETAHQLGTPTTAIVGWVEHLMMIREDDEEIMEVAAELRKDVDRLELIADRFSKIGASPKLEPIDVFQALEKSREYMQRRASRRVEFHFPGLEHPPLLVYINPPLFDWVAENLLRNALDALEGQGSVSAEVYHDQDYVYIDFADTGKGIPSNKFNAVFRPGFTTKKRGWGLGLSLAKRIIEEYHNGKIFVKRSEEGVGTTFTIQLPKNPR
jgi:signal transduction histidine kinase